MKQLKHSRSQRLKIYVQWHLFYWTRCRMVWLCDGEKKFEDMFIHFDRIHERDGWTDGRRDRQTDAAKITWGFGEGARVPCPSLGTAPVRR